MTTRKPLATALIVGLVVLAASVSVGAGESANDKMYVTFNRPVSLPGVALGSGTYLFQRLELNAHSAVRVLSRDGKINHYTGFTSAVERPAGLKRAEVISFAEASPGAPQPIAIWWHADTQGREFIYPKK
jgi:hypothetical protein